MEFLFLTSIPFIVLALLFLIVDNCWKLNLRLATVLMCVVVEIYELSLLIKGIELFSEEKVFQQNINYLANKCMVEGERQVLGIIWVSFGISEVYSYLLGALCLVIALMIAFKMVLRLVEYKYKRLK